MFFMGNLLRKLIEWAFFKYVVDFHLENAESQALNEEWSDNFNEKFVVLASGYENEVEKAMYEKQYYTLH
jgi:hypothetical protein